MRNLSVVHQNSFGLILKDNICGSFILFFDDQTQTLKWQNLKELRTILSARLTNNECNDCACWKKQRLKDFLELIDWAYLREEIYTMLNLKIPKSGY
ncbi:MAG: hypothetical protein MRY83_06155 [Flavobacteriales bacterium]|nr:hypothetical protein [Flavobacteriales bacterium]